MLHYNKTLQYDQNVTVKTQHNHSTVESKDSAIKAVSEYPVTKLLPSEHLKGVVKLLHQHRPNQSLDCS